MGEKKIKDANTRGINAIKQVGWPQGCKWEKSLP